MTEAVPGHDYDQMICDELFGGKCGAFFCSHGYKGCKAFSGQMEAALEVADLFIGRSFVLWRIDAGPDQDHWACEIDGSNSGPQIAPTLAICEAARKAKR